MSDLASWISTRAVRVWLLVDLPRFSHPAIAGVSRFFDRSLLFLPKPELVSGLYTASQIVASRDLTGKLVWRPLS
jgi:hypothetical protein